MTRGRSKEHSRPSPTKSTERTAQEVLFEFYFAAFELLHKEGILSPDQLTPGERERVELFLFQLLQKTTGDIKKIEVSLPKKI